MIQYKIWLNDSPSTLIAPASTFMKLFVLVIALFLSACTTYDRPLVMPEPIKLQDPMPGGAVVYLMAGPHDAMSYAIYSSGRLLAKLKPASYTVLFLNAGSHHILTRDAGLRSYDKEAAPPLQLDLKPGDRLFFNISGHQGSYPIVMPGPKGSIAHVESGMRTTRGTRTWKQCTELDAQGLMSILDLAVPEN